MKRSESTLSQPAVGGFQCRLVAGDGEVIIGDDWLTGFGITEAEQLEITAAPGMILLRRR